MERELSLRIMRGGVKPRIEAVKQGSTLVEQGDKGSDMYVLLDGVLAVEVNGEAVAQVGPGAVLGERALLEGGLRTATLRALTACKVAAATGAELAPEMLSELAAGHRREGLRLTDRCTNPVQRDLGWQGGELDAATAQQPVKFGSIQQRAEIARQAGWGALRSPGVQGRRRLEGATRRRRRPPLNRGDPAPARTHAEMHREARSPESPGVAFQPSLATTTSTAPSSARSAWL